MDNEPTTLTATELIKRNEEYYAQKQREFDAMTPNEKLAHLLALQAAGEWMFHNC